MKHKVLLLVCIILVGSASAEVITIFDANDTITSADTYDTVVIKGDGTVVDMTGGNITKLIVMDSARFNISGGRVHSAALVYDSGMIYASGTSYLYVCDFFQDASIYITGAADINRLYFYQNSSIEMNSHGATISSMNFYDSATASLNAGSCNSLGLFQNSQVDIAGAEIIAGTRVSFAEGDNVKLTVSSGTLGSIYLNGHGSSARIRVSGGFIKDVIASPREAVSQFPLLEIVGYDLTAVPYGGDLGRGTMSGYWNDGTFFQIQLQGSAYTACKLYDGTLPPDPLPSLQAQITALQQANVLLVQQNVLLLQKVEENRYLLEQLPQFKKLLDELQAAVEEEDQP